MKKHPEKFTREWFVEQGRIGGLKTKEKYGTKQFEKLNKIRWGKKGDKSKHTDKPLVK